MIRKCDTCGKDYETNNKHRNECYDCRLVKVPRLEKDKRPVSKKQIIENMQNKKKK